MALPGREPIEALACGPLAEDRRRNVRQVVLEQLGPWPRLDMEELDTGITSNRRAQCVNSAVLAEMPLGKRYCTAMGASL
jgi:hypothetical protein